MKSFPVIFPVVVALIATYLYAVPAVSGQERPDEVEAKPAVVLMTDKLKYDPDLITVKIGDTVEWKNSSRFVHTVTADPSLAVWEEDASVPEGAETFNSGDIEPGETFRHTFEVPGEYRYFCIPHEISGMKAKVMVEE